MTKNIAQMYSPCLEGGEKTLAYMSMSLPPYLGTECGLRMSGDFLLPFTCLAVQLVQALGECEAVVPQFSTYFMKNFIIEAQYCGILFQIILMTLEGLGTFTLIVSGHPYCHANSHAMPCMRAHVKYAE